MPRRVLIDTDPGVDDALALLYALRSPELEVAAITTVCGNVPVQRGTRNVFTVLSLLPEASRVPVSEGAEAPLAYRPEHAGFLHGEDGLGGVESLTDAEGRRLYGPVTVEPTDRRASDEILYWAASSREPPTLIALGPLTNIAEALRRDRATMARVERIVLMGGAYAVPGNITPAAEFNMYFDPDAAAEVFESGLSLTAVGLDVTRKARLSRDGAERAGAGATLLGRFLLDSTEKLFAYARRWQDRADIPLHDPLAVAIAEDPALAGCEPLHVAVETRGLHTRGATVADRRALRAECKARPNADVCLRIDAARFLDRFLERLLCPGS
jgi:purine nucleosidase/pyrimidine-specific ribonucleoside hydrolase